MGYEYRITQLPIINILYKHPQLFSLEQCIHILEKTYNIQGQYGNEHSYYSSKIIVKSQHTFSLVAYDVNSLKYNDQQIEIYSERVSFSSFNGPLPSIYTEKIKALEWSKDYALSDFMNIFINRLSGISYRISVRKNINLQSNNKTNLGQCLQSLANNSIIQYAYLLWNSPHSALGLRSIISSFFNVPVQIHQFCGSFTPLNATCKLGQQKSYLANDAVLGSQFFDYYNGIKISIGPLDSSVMQDFETDNSLYKQLIELISTYLDETIDYTIEFIPQQPTEAKINHCKLGYNTWLIAKHNKYDNRYVFKRIYSKYKI